jgi:hypothetical protein
MPVARNNTGNKSRKLTWDKQHTRELFRGIASKTTRLHATSSSRCT